MGLDGPKESRVRWGSRGAKVVAMATTFSLSMGYKFGCIIASDMLFDTRTGFSGSS